MGAASHRGALTTFWRLLFVVFVLHGLVLHELLLLQSYVNLVHMKRVVMLTPAMALVHVLNVLIVIHYNFMGMIVNL